MGPVFYPMCKWGWGAFFLGQFCISLDVVLERPQISWSALASPNQHWEQTKNLLSLLPQRSGKYHLRWASHVLTHFSFKYVDVYSLGAISLSPQAAQMNDCSRNWRQSSAASKLTGVSERCLDAVPVSEVLSVCAGFWKGLLMREGAVGEQFVSPHRRCLTW